MDSMLAVPTKPGKVQLNLWVDESVNTALSSAAVAAGLRGRTQMAEMIIKQWMAELPAQQPTKGNYIVDTPQRD